MDEIHEGDIVYVTMSNNDIKEGKVVKITDGLAFNYIVEMELHGSKKVKVFCNRKDLALP